jgi:hypothetical protein
MQRFSTKLKDPVKYWEDRKSLVLHLLKKELIPDHMKKNLQEATKSYLISFLALTDFFLFDVKF